MLQQLESPTQERYITLHNVSWESLKLIESALQDYVVRLTYLDGTLDIMTPSPEHEDRKRTIGLLLEAYLRFASIRFYDRGSPTLGRKELGVKGEPDESYNLGTKKDIPDIAIEVVITSGGVDKLEKYRRWGVPEVWFWKDNQISVYHLQQQSYEKITKSELLPGLDLALIIKCANIPDQYDAVIAFEQALRQNS